MKKLKKTTFEFHIVKEDVLKTKNIKILMAVGCVGLFIICSWLMSMPCPEQYVGVVNVPVFINKVSPAPDSQVTFGCYHRRILELFMRRAPLSLAGDQGISAKISTGSFINQELPNPNHEDTLPFEDRVSLYVDEQKQNKWFGSTLHAGFVGSPSNIIPVAGQYIFGSYSFLLPGNHTAKLIIVTRSGKTLEYEWHFKITVW
jgi:hypothetical protein